MIYGQHALYLERAGLGDGPYCGIILFFFGLLIPLLQPATMIC